MTFLVKLVYKSDINLIGLSVDTRNAPPDPIASPKINFVIVHARAEKVKDNECVQVLDLFPAKYYNNLKIPKKKNGLLTALDTFNAKPFGWQ